MRRLGTLVRCGVHLHSARPHVHTSFARWCLLAHSSIADQGAVLVYWLKFALNPVFINDNAINWFKLALCWVFCVNGLTQLWSVIDLIRLVRLPQRSGGASVVRGISQSCAGETFGYAAQGRSQRPQTCRVDAPWYGTRAMQVTTPRVQNCARRAQFCVSVLCPLAQTPFDEISRNLIQGYSATRAFKICIS